MNDDLFDGCLSIDPACQREDIYKELAALPACKGVIFFADSENNPIQLLIAANIRRTARSRLIAEETQSSTKRPDITRIASKIFYVCCYNDFQSALTHYKIAKALFPEDYRKLTSPAKLNLVKINPSANWPSFSLASTPFVSEDEKVFGLFQSRKSAAKFIKILQDAFSLCKRPDLTDDPAKAASCPYLQMETCAAPCVGNISREDYQIQIEQAVQAACGLREMLKDKLLERMEGFSMQTAFEEASKVKKQIEQIELLDKPAFRWTGDLQKISILHIDLSAKVKVEGKRKKRQDFAGFLLHAGNVYEFDPFSLDSIDQFHRSVLAETKRHCETFDRKALPERISLFAFSLYRSKPAGIWINCSDAMGLSFPEDQELRESIYDFFNFPGLSEGVGNE